jgi:diguanylate cyclase (GGDEF)-like protein
VAGRPSDDRPADLTNGTIGGQRGSSASGLGALEDEQTLADGEQTLADSDQTLADSDQTGSDADQTSSESDQFAADRDQVASDRDLASGVDAEAHEFSRDIRERSARQRGRSSLARLGAAEARDVSAEARDYGALARDQAAEARDVAMAERDAVSERDAGVRLVTGADIVVRAAGARKRAERQRVQAAGQRALAAKDRQDASRDREQADADRHRAVIDREALSRQVAVAETDPVTGARALAAGLTELDHELDRCRETGGLLVVAYVDVVAPAALGDKTGHSASDELLTRAVGLVSEHLRSFDLIIRIGGDQFLCAMPSMTLVDARERFSQVAAALAASADAGAIRIGFAQLTPDETVTVTELIARADSELSASRNGKPDS